MPVWWPGWNQHELDNDGLPLMAGQASPSWEVGRTPSGARLSRLESGVWWSCVAGMLGALALTSAPKWGSRPCHLPGIAAQASVVESAVGDFRICLPKGYAVEAAEGGENWRWAGSPLTAKPTFRVRLASSTDHQASAVEAILGIDLENAGESRCIDCYQVGGVARAEVSLDGIDAAVEKATVDGGFEHYHGMVVWGYAWRRGSGAGDPGATHLLVMIPVAADTMWVRSVITSLRWNVP